METTKGEKDEQKCFGISERLAVRRSVTKRCCWTQIVCETWGFLFIYCRGGKADNDEEEQDEELGEPEEVVEPNTPSARETMQDACKGSGSNSDSKCASITGFFISSSQEHVLAEVDGGCGSVTDDDEGNSENTRREECGALHHVVELLLCELTGQRQRERSAHN